MSIEMEVIIEGKVQGVFFRKTVYDHAKHFSIVGFVKNLSNGSVQIVAQGEKKEVEAFLQEIQKKPGQGVIKHISLSFKKIEKLFSTFSIE